MKFVCISDTHNRHEELIIPEADMIVHSGDLTSTGTTRQIREFCEWYGKLPHKYKILIAGNHDWGFEKDRFKHEEICGKNGIIYLQDSGVEIEGIKIWGSPRTPEFFSWAFNCWRTLDEEENRLNRKGKRLPFIGRFWAKIPKDTDILLTHGPPYDIMDECPDGSLAGCEILAKKVKHVAPKFHIFGHIHGQNGELKVGETIYINASSLGEDYYPNGKEVKVYEI